MTIYNELLDDLTKIIIPHLYVSQSLQIMTDSIQVYIVRNNITNMNMYIDMQDAQIKVPSYSNLMISVNCSDQIVTQRVIKE